MTETEMLVAQTERLATATARVADHLDAQQVEREKSEAALRAWSEGNAARTAAELRRLRSQQSDPSMVFVIIAGFLLGYFVVGPALVGFMRAVNGDDS